MCVGARESCKVLRVRCWVLGVKCKVLGVRFWVLDVRWCVLGGIPAASGCARATGTASGRPRASPLIRLNGREGVRVCGRV